MQDRPATRDAAATAVRERRPTRRAAAVLAAVLLTACQGASPPAPRGSEPTSATSVRSPAATATSAATAHPSLTETFTSSVHGISVAYPQGWVVRRAKDLWTEGIPFGGSTFADVIHSPTDENDFFGIASQALGRQPGAEWAETISRDRGWEDTCAARSEPITIDDQPGLLVVHCPSQLPTALGWTGGRGYLLVLYPETDLTWFRAFLDSVRLAPADALKAP